MIRLEQLTLENFRGFGVRSPLNLGGAGLILLYGQNGRGKSSVFHGLEWTLLPARTRADLRRDAGDRAPLTNRFRGTEAADVGSAELVVTENGQRIVLRQEVLNALAEISVLEAPLQARLRAHEHSIFFTQRVLRDLMLSSPRGRYQQIKQLLGCDGYDALARIMWTWLEEKHLKLGYLAYQVERAKNDLETVVTSLQGKLKAMDLTGVDPESLDLVFLPFFHSIRDELAASDQQLTDLCFSDTQAVSFSALLGEFTAADERMKTIRETLETFSLQEEWNLTERQRSAFPPRWLDTLEQRRRTFWGAMKSFAPVRDKSLQAMPPDLQLGNDPGWGQLESLAFMNDLLGEHRDIYSQLKASSLEQLGLLSRQIQVFRQRADRFSRLLAPYIEAIKELKRIGDVFGLVGENRDGSPDETAHSALKRKRDVVNAVWALTASLSELSQMQLEMRIRPLEDRWNQYYGEISSYSHFQQTKIQTEFVKAHQDSAPTSSGTEYLVRFLVSDPEDKCGEKHRMEFLLSEGQLNCAVVSLVLSLTDMRPESPKLLALDDPFVSWDDANMENFMGTIRQLVGAGWTVVLTTSDVRVVTSARRNMETLQMKQPAMIFNFYDWKREQGPCYEREPVSPRFSGHLWELPKDEWEAEYL